MSKVKNLSEFSVEQLEEFLTSFDTVMSDIDGVISYNGIFIEGASETLKRLEQLGKQVYLVTNNSTYTEEEYCKISNIPSNRVINPVKVIIWYLKKIDFHGEILAIVSSMAWEALTKAGFQLVKPRSFLEKKKVIKEVLDRPSVKAVIIDFDIDCNWLKLALAASCLKRNDVLYISGATDNWVIVNSEITILGPGPFVRLLNSQTERLPIVCSKPSEILKDYILKTCNITDPQKCLFIGDTLDHDIKFAEMCGFSKLLVGTGVNSLEQIQDTCPDYYLPNLSQLFAAYKEPNNGPINHKNN